MPPRKRCDCQFPNPYEQGTQYNVIYALLTGPRRLTRKELTALAAQACGKSEQVADYSVWVVVSPREGGRNPRGNRSAKGHLYYVSEDGDGRLHVHPRSPPLDSLAAD